MSTTNGGEHKYKQHRIRPILPFWFYLLLGAIIVGLMRLLEWLHEH